ncbi:hypothetical protein MP228_004779 [Amoeboaphelidium protococcarum]|nr:hypothetical protein MP228_004779 [Amoeboaphelidium protococcarum]
MLQQLITDQIKSENALVIVAPGLGIFGSILQWIVACIKVDLSENGSNEVPLVFLLNASDEENQLIRDSIQRYGLRQKQGELFRVVDSTLSVQDRQKLYLRGGVISVSTRFLVVDWLNDRVPYPLVSGVILMHADKLAKSLEASYESFALKLFRESNQAGFIKAFSDRPEAFAAGFNRLEKTLRYLHVDQVYFYPRFHVQIVQSLEAVSIDMHECQQPMTAAMNLIQRALIDIMDGLLLEIRRSNQNLDAEILTVENALSKDFDFQLRLLLDPQWHRVSPRMKRTISDLTEMRKLLKYLVQYDCISFWEYLENALLSEGLNRDGFVSPWLTMDASDTLIKYARERVYKVTNGDSGVKQLQTVLELNPKWILVQELIKDLQTLSSDISRPRRILILVNDIKTSYQLKEFLCCDRDGITDQNKQGSDNHYMQKLWSKYIYRSQQMKTLITKLKQQSPSNDMAQQPSVTTTSGNGEQQRSQQAIAQPARKRQRRQRGAHNQLSGTTPAGDKSKSAELKFESMLNQIQEEGMHTLEATDDMDDLYDDSLQAPQTAIGELAMISNDSTHIVIQVYDNDNYGIAQQHLQDFHPDAVIMMDPNPQYIREIESFALLNPSHKLQVYFVVYEHSVEEQRYLTTIKKEKQAFERLIREKSMLSVREGDLRVHREELSSSNALVNRNRIGGGSLQLDLPALNASAPLAERPLIIVDMREFRSQLPVILHANGFHVRPIQIEIGDYILTPKICVERKSLPDLVGSIQSGRLFSQLEAMSLHYETVILLIEFDPGKSFSLQDIKIHTTGSNAQQSTVIQRLVQFTLQFPNMRIVWSTSPHATADIFKDLKLKQPDPDVEAVMRIGADVFLQQQPQNHIDNGSSRTVDNNDNGDSAANSTSLEFNVIPVDMLRYMPGCEGLSWKYLVNQVQDLKELCMKSLAELSSILGNDEGARQLHKFLHDSQNK